MRKTTFRYCDLRPLIYHPWPQRRTLASSARVKRGPTIKPPESLWGLHLVSQKNYIGLRTCLRFHDLRVNCINRYIDLHRHLTHRFTTFNIIKPNFIYISKVCKYNLPSFSADARAFVHRPSNWVSKNFKKNPLQGKKKFWEPQRRVILLSRRGDESEA